MNFSLNYINLFYFLIIKKNIFIIFYYLFICLNIFSFEQELFNSSSLPLPIINNKQIINELVDQIESIDVFSNQLIILTTRQGPPDMAKVMIQIVDIENGEVLPNLNLTGILLLITRGKYTINWLKPNHWYGIYFRAEQSYNGGKAIYANEEAYLLKTKRIDEIINGEIKQIIKLRIFRNDENGNSVENLIIKMKWEQPKEERQNLDGLANITLFCNEQINYKQLKLNGNEEEKLLEINLDNNFEINENNENNIRKLNALIIPKNCTRICWNVELLAKTNLKIFRRSAIHNCEEIEKINITTYLRNYINYEYNKNKQILIIYTNYNGNEKYGYIKLTAIEIILNNNKEINKNNQTTIIDKIFNTENNENNFILEKLQNGKYYAVQYTYGKTSPFIYEESQRFLINTNSLDEPLIWQFNIINNDNKGIKLLNIIATAILGFENYEIGVDVEPLCEFNNNKTLHFWLNKENNKKELTELNILDFLCTILPKYYICQIPGNAVMIKGCFLINNNNNNLCWITNIIVNEKLYSEKRKCLSLINSVPQLPEKIKIIPGNISQINNTKLLEKNNCNNIKINFKKEIYYLIILFLLILNNLK